MSLHKLTAGDGYTYLTRQVAAHDATSRGYGGLGDYYAQKGESPGVWMGQGCSAVPDFLVSGPVTEAQMRALFGEGRHPDADRLQQELAAAGHGPAAIEAATRLGSPFRVYDGAGEFRRLLAERFDACNADAGLPRDWPVPAGDRARIRTEVATELFTAEFGRPPADPRELSGFVARASRQQTTAVAGYDLTFSPVKSVSALWALAPRGVAEQVEAAHAAAVTDALDWLERSATFTRTGRNGVAQVEVAGLIAAAFTHRDSRAGDPDLHTHVAISNKVRTRDSRWLALDGRPLHKLAVAASERYNTRLEAHLSAALGLRFAERPDPDPGKRPVREVRGLEPALLTAWSSRRAAIDTRRAQLSARFQAEHGRTPTVVEALKLAQQATLETREAKHEPRSLGEQSATWRQQATAALGGEQQLTRMLREALQPRGPAAGRARWRPRDVAAAAEQVLATVSAARATWQETHVRAEAERLVRSAETVLAGVDDAVEAIVAATLSPALSVPLGLPDRLEEPAALRRSDGTSVYELAGAQLYTSARVLDAEQRILAAAHRRDGRVLTPRTVDLALAESAANGVELNPGQAQLVRELATSGARVQLALAPAGTGKTTAMAVLARAWRDSGGDVFGLAPSAAAAAVLRNEISGQTDTLAKLLYSLDTGEHPEWVRRIGAGTLVLVDEAGMAGTADLARVLDFVLDRGGSVRLLGDDSQLAAIGAGGVLRDLAETVGAVALSQVMRFSDPAEAAASLALRGGDPTGIAYYLDHSRVHVGDPGTVAEQAYSAWAADRADGRDAVLLAPTRDLVAQLNARARADRLAADGPAGAEVQLADGSWASAGDVIATGRNDRRIPISATDWVKNGDRWRVAAVEADGSLRVTHLPTGRRVRLPTDYVAEHVALGYATTVHAAQGITADVCHTVVTGAENRQLLYVALTRGRDRNSLYLSTANDGDPHAVITRDALLPPTAVDVLTRVLAADGAQTSATTTRRTLHDPAPRLAQAADAYYDAVTTAAELHLGPDWVTSTDAAAETLRPGLPSAPAYPTLRAHLALLTLDGHDSAAVLREAIISRELDTAADVAAVLDWRLDPSGGHSATAGPLPWVPAIPQTLADDPAWAGYLARRDQQVRTLAAAVEENSRNWTPSDAPGWARPLLYRDPRLLAHLAVWRAAQRVAGDDPTLTGPVQPRAADRRTQRALQDHAEAVLGDPATPARQWAPIADAINPRLASDPYWPPLAHRLSAAARAGIDITTLTTRVAAERPLPDEMPAAALWWRLAGHLSPAALDAAGTTAPDTLRPAWTPTLASIVGQATADRVVADHTWPALVAAVTTAGAAGWTPADALRTANDLLAGGTDDDTSIAADQLAQALAWRVRLLSDASCPSAPTPSLDDPPPLDEPDVEEDERPSAEDVAWLNTAEGGGRGPGPPPDTTDADTQVELDPWLAALTHASLDRALATFRHPTCSRRAARSRRRRSLLTGLRPYPGSKRFGRISRAANGSSI